MEITNSTPHHSYSIPHDPDPSPTQVDRLEELISNAIADFLAFGNELTIAAAWIDRNIDGLSMDEQTLFQRLFQIHHQPNR